MADLDRLAELARAATPDTLDDEGWYVLDGKRVSVTKPNTIGGGFDSICVALTNEPADAAYIAACSPSTVLALVEVAKAAKVLQNHRDEGVTLANEAWAALRAALEGVKHG